MMTPFEELKQSRWELITSFSKGDIVHAFRENYTEIVDQYFRRSLQESEAGHKLFKEKRDLALVAVGGYGRKELCIHSDIDVIILFGSKIPHGASDLVREVFFPLWDLGLDLAYGIRTIKDCLNLSKKNFEVLTSLIDARFLGGDSPLYLSLMEGLKKKVISRNAIALSRWLINLDKIRMETKGDASYLLEPNLKDGIGGLRDYHHMLWLAMAFFDAAIPRDLEYMGKLSHQEYQDLLSQVSFIWLVRNHLHHLCARKNDRLGFEYQEEIARRLMFQDRKGFPAVEQFMGNLHASMASIKSLHRSFLKSHLPIRRIGKRGSHPDGVSPGLHIYQGAIGFDSATAILSNPLVLINIFGQSSISKYPLSMEAMRLVREFLYLVDDPYRESKEAAQGFLNIMKEEGAIEGLNQMFETKFLDAFIPEFERIRDRVQFDAYHIFPVGRHSLETVRALKGLADQKEMLLMDIYSDLLDPQPLHLAALFHDIGKFAKNHAVKGASITKNILRRLGYPKKETEDVLFLIRHHLLLMETATRRDLDDEKIVVQCARTIGDMRRLKMLYLLSWADSTATGPRAWNEWIANLVKELFFKIIHILQSQELATPFAFRTAKDTLSEVQRLLKGQIGRPELDDLFEVMTPRYLLNTRPGEIVHHIRVVKNGRSILKDGLGDSFVLEVEEDEPGACWEIIFIAGDRPGLFSDLAGVLSLHNINILSAQIYTWRDGTAVDIFKVTAPLDTLHHDEVFSKVREDLRRVFKGKLALQYRLDEKEGSSPLFTPGIPSRPPKVTIDNEASDFFTLVEVFADDRVGILYIITRALFDLRLDVRIAKISTKLDQVADIFYVRDLEGQKVEDEEQVEEIKRGILHQLERKAPEDPP